MADATCINCGDRPARSKTQPLCQSCYMRWWRYGDPEGGTDKTWNPRAIATTYFEARYLLPVAHDPGWDLSTAADTNSYGKLTTEDGLIGAHVLSCIRAHGPKPDWAEVVLHACRNRACFWAEHLRWGLHADNHLDQVRDGTVSEGERNGLAKLTDEAIREIRARYVPRKVSQRYLAAEYGVSQAVIWSVLHHQTWDHVV